MTGELERLEAQGEPQIYIHRPHIYKAVQWTGFNLQRVKRFARTPEGSRRAWMENGELYLLHDVTGNVWRVQDGDWIARGQLGQYYPTNEALFANFYTDVAPGQFRREPFELRALRWTGENADTVKDFVGRDIIGKPRVYRVSEDMLDLHETNSFSWVRVHRGDWIINRAEDDFFPVSQKTFPLAYDPAT